MFASVVHQRSVKPYLGLLFVCMCDETKNVKYLKKIQFGFKQTPIIKIKVLIRGGVKMLFLSQERETLFHCDG